MARFSSWLSRTPLAGDPGRAVRLGLAAAAALALAASPALADRTEKTLDLGGGKKLVYQLVTPDKPLAAARPVPVLLVFPPGDQGTNMVNLGLQPFDPACRERGWVVIAPQVGSTGGASSTRELFFSPGSSAAAMLPALIAEVGKSFTIEGGKVHVAGASNGGISAIHFATEHPELCHSVLAYPGYARKPAADRLERLAERKIPLRLWVGSDDLVEWTDGVKQTAARAKDAGLDVALEIREAQGHMIENLSEDLFTALESFRPRQSTMDAKTAAAHTSINQTLDALHDAASKAEFDRYFDQYAPGAIFIGTDAKERWTLEEFKTYAKPHFDKGKGKGGWTYRPRDRHVSLAPDGRTAWFDEMLDHDKYGTCRGTGVLIKIGPDWRVTQYHLTVPVPNELMERVVKMIGKPGK